MQHRATGPICREYRAKLRHNSPKGRALYTDVSPTRSLLHIGLSINIVRDDASCIRSRESRAGALIPCAVWRAGAPLRRCTQWFFCRAIKIYNNSPLSRSPNRVSAHSPTQQRVHISNAHLVIAGGHARGAGCEGQAVRGGWWGGESAGWCRSCGCVALSSTSTQ